MRVKDVAEQQCFPPLFCAPGAFPIISAGTETLILTLSPGRVSCFMAKVRLSTSEVDIKSMFARWVTWEKLK